MSLSASILNITRQCKSKEMERRRSRISVLHSDLTLTLELFHNTDHGSAAREILPPMVANIEATYSNAYPTIKS